MDAPLAKRLAVARGDEPADLVVRGGKVLSVFTREWLDADVAIVDGWIAGLGDYEGRETLDATGRWVVRASSTRTCTSSRRSCSSTSSPASCCRSGRPRSSPIRTRSRTCSAPTAFTGCSTRPQALPLDVYFMASSCVPASHFESPRRALTPGDLDALLRRRRVIGVAEMMNFPGVISGAPSELAKLALADHVDGHAPGVLGRDLNAYAAAGIRSDHEAYSPEEGLERLRAGMWLLIREGSAARNLHALLPLLAEYGPSRIAFCTDDREPEHIADDGHINSMVRDAVAFGIPRRGRARLRDAQPRPLARARPPRRGRARVPRRPARAAGSGALRPRDGVEARPARSRDPARRTSRTGRDTPCGSARSGRRCSACRGPAAPPA